MALEKEDDLVNDGSDVLLLEVDNEVGLLGSLIGVIDTGEALDLASASGGIGTLSVSLLAVLEGSSDVDEEEGAGLPNESAGLLSGSLKGSNRGSDNGSTGLGQLGGDESDSVDVEITVLSAEAELGRKLVSDSLAEKHGDRSATTLHESCLEGSGNLVLSRVLVTGHEDGEALLGREGVLLSENLDDLGVREPGRNVLAGSEAVSQLGTRDVGGASTLGDLVGGLVLIGVGEVDHLLELNHLDAKLTLELLDEVLSIIRTVVVLSVLVLARTSVVTADDEVGSTVVLSDDGVPEGLTGTTHSHGEGEEGESSHAVGVAGQESLVDSDTSEVVNVTGLGQADNRLDEDVGLLGAGSTNSQLTVSSVHGVSGLESDDLLPAELVEVSAELGGGDFGSVSTLRHHRGCCDLHRRSKKS